MIDFFKEINDSCSQLNIDILPKVGWVGIERLDITYLDKFMVLDLMPTNISFNTASKIHCFIYKVGDNCNNCPYALTGHKCIEDENDFLTDIDENIFNILDNTPISTQATVWYNFRKAYVNATVELLNIYIDGLDSSPTLTLEDGVYYIDGIFNLGRHVQFKVENIPIKGEVIADVLVLTISSEVFLMSNNIKALPIFGN